MATTIWSNFPWKEVEEQEQNGTTESFDTKDVPPDVRLEVNASLDYQKGYEAGRQDRAKGKSRLSTAMRNLLIDEAYKKGIEEGKKMVTSASTEELNAKIRDAYERGQQAGYLAGRKQSNKRVRFIVSSARHFSSMEEYLEEAVKDLKFPTDEDD